jgi:antitoxin ParD1/3/4
VTQVLLSLPKSLNDWAAKQAANHNFESVGDYVENVLNQEKERLEALEEFDRLVQEGEDSGVSERSVDEILTEARRIANDRFHAEI